MLSNRFFIVFANLFRCWVRVRVRVRVRVKCNYIRRGIYGDRIRV